MSNIQDLMEKFSIIPIEENSNDDSLNEISMIT